MQGVFISYRRLDSQSAAGRLADHLKTHLPQVPLFRDVETIEPGVDFVDAINRALQSCAVLLAVIGPRWVTLTDANGQRRLDDANDYTRLEIVTALQRSDVRVIPVLVEGAQMPSTHELPEDLRPLCRRNALELTDKRWVYDMSQLEETLRKALDVIDPIPGPTPRPIPKPAPTPKQLPWYQRWEQFTVKQWVYVSIGIVLLSAVSEYYIREGQIDDDYDEPYATGGYVAPENALTANQSANQSAASAPQAQVNQNAVTNNASTLSGYWQDSEGGQYQVVQQGQQVAVQGSNPYGAVYGRGVIANNLLNLQYTINGVPYAAALTMDANGGLVGRYGSNVTGLSGNMALRRIR